MRSMLRVQCSVEYSEGKKEWDPGPNLCSVGEGPMSLQLHGGREGECVQADV